MGLRGRQEWEVIARVGDGGRHEGDGEPQP